MRSRIVFAGTPDFAVPVLDALLASGHEVCAVYTQPDRPAGRGRTLAASPVKRRACDAGLEVRQPHTLREVEAHAELAALEPQLMVVVAYGLILPQAVLDIPRRGCVNVHASLLPRWRGAAPIQRAILAGDAETGVGLMRMETGLDTGPVYAEARLAIAPGTTGGELHRRLSVLGARLLAEHLDALLAGRLEAKPQDPARACYAAKLEKAEAELDWNRPAIELERQVRAFNPWPVAQTRCEEAVLRIWRATAEAGAAEAAPGTVLAEGRDGILVACGEGRLRLTELQPPGKRAMTAADFVNARRLAGTVLGAR